MNPLVLRVIGLPVAMTAVMFGLVFAVNPGIYGVLGLTGGIAGMGAGMVLCRILFRYTEMSPSPDGDNLSKHGDGEKNT